MTKIITNIQAYQIAINTLKIFEDKWKMYVEEEARLMNVFDGEE